MQEEMDSHERMKTWGPPIDLPKGATSTNTKFLFSVKAINLSHNNADIASKANKQVLGGDGGEYERYRARLLYLNNHFTSEPSHWTELYTPAIDKTSVRTFLTVCAMKCERLSSCGLIQKTCADVVLSSRVTNSTLT